MKTLLVTGAAGFVGYHLSRRLLDRGDRVIGIDNLNDYYSVQLKRDRLAQLEGRPGFSFAPVDLADAAALNAVFASAKFDGVINLGAQAGVRYSLTHPQAYVQSNLVGFANILEACRHHGLPPLLYASSSSVYGANEKMPWAVADNVDHPVSLYAATKKSNELMAHTYAHLYGLACTGLRFFTVYGSWGRPDMAYFKFTKAILAGEAIDVYNHGRMQRDFTYIDDVVEAVVRLTDRPATGNPDWNAQAPDPASSRAPYRVYNIGNHQPVELLDFIAVLEDVLGRKATMNLLPMQAGDVVATYADTAALQRDVGFAPATPIAEGLRRFADWYRGYYGG
ncbi:MAG: uge [Hydrocarboniphaga sp.]|uniref:NAD-dependent epimerase n=1 Tax=Hydrocarboniphaga sp. TaxID=2033016 RepID=UPI0026328B09|nr:NAD-dependent epimerase [Hydrocarboniphaga sp.]MDB5970930.1 uge [Hydrocarboniphaga sp.]